MVYDWCMSRTNVDIDDDACAQVMRMYNLDTKREAINLALRKLAVVPMTKAEAMAMEGFWKDRPADDPIVPDDDGLHHWRTDADR
jgi:Arc/MetJ family transcription regulator